MAIREVKIEEYWPLIVKGTEEFGQIAAALNPEFNLLAERIYNALNDAFIKSATPDGVSRWENMLGLAVTDDMTLDDRKTAILYHLSIKLPYTMPVLRQMLNGLLGEGKYILDIDNDTELLTMKLEDAAQRENVIGLLARVLPKNLEFNVE